MTTDPVCGMEIDARKAAAASDHDGQRYFFCSQECKRTFDRNPEFYLDDARETDPQPKLERAVRR